MGINNLNISERGEKPRLFWDIGTAYDLFVSLEVLHHPEEYGLRASWAAGVRSRLPVRDRKFLEESLEFLGVPHTWIYSLSEPKDSDRVLRALKELPAEDRLQTLLLSYDVSPKVIEIMEGITAKDAWDDKDLKALRAEVNIKHKGKGFETLLKWWLRKGEWGELFLAALQAYQTVFFAEEEKRIAPILVQGLDQAKEMAEHSPVPQLLAELSQGVHFDEYIDVAELILVPSYWSTPLVFYSKIAPDRMLISFGVRPADMSLVPGENVPDTLLQALKAMSDPTRLRILHYLKYEPMTLTELSSRLRLRAPTVTHHLRELRLASLVHLMMIDGEERLYTARLEAIDSICTRLMDYLESEVSDRSE
jgi:DNA-binding transcriptional ArsR family regulator